MDLLVLGGTAWLGREVAARALARGHAVTCLARGEAGEVAEGARLVRVDRERDDAYDSVLAAHWDAVVDVARQPGQVRRAVAALEPATGRYVFVSSVNAYASQRELDRAEDAVLLPQLRSDVMESMEHYGEAKVACEQAVLDRFEAERTLIARVGLIGGPGDWSGRSGYWPWRFARPSNPGGAVLVPDDPDVTTAVIDVRDLATWLVTSAETGTSGVFNAAGNRLRLADHLSAARAVAGHSGPVVAAPPAWLQKHGVQNWMGHIVAAVDRRPRLVRHERPQHRPSPRRRPPSPSAGADALRHPRLGTGPPRARPARLRAHGRRRTKAAGRPRARSTLARPPPPARVCGAAVRRVDHRERILHRDGCSTRRPATSWGTQTVSGAERNGLATSTLWQ